MNRHDRRKLSRNASNDEIFPGAHGPVQSEFVMKMTAVMDALKLGFPNCDITLFVAERAATEGRDAPRFNYMSTADRRDMYAVLRAFLAKNEPIAAKLDEINKPAASGKPQ